MVVVPCTDGFLKVGLYGHNLNLVVASTFDKLCDESYETLLLHNPGNGCVREHDRVGEVALPSLQIGGQVYTFYPLGY